MKIERKLTAWQDAGLIDDEAVRRILEHESEHERPLALYAIGGVGSVAIVLGLIAIIAANWAEISGPTKLSADLLMGVGLAVAIARSSPGWVREILILVYYGFVLASIGLIGQIYHLESAPWRALVVWSVITLPLMLGIRGHFGSSVWLAGLVLTHSVGFFELIDWLNDALDLSGRLQANLTVVLLAVSPLAYLGFARLGWTLRERPNFASVFWLAGWIGIAGLSLSGVGFFYATTTASATTALETLPRVGALAGLAVWSLCALYLPKLDPSLRDRALLGFRSILLAGGALSFFALVVPHDSWDLAGALGQLVLLAVFAWAALQAGYRGAFRLCTGAVCIRLFVIYLEVFGSLLETGLGLILGGALAIALSFAWVRRTKFLEAQLQPSKEVSDRSSEGDAT